MAADRREFLKIYAWIADNNGGICSPRTAVLSIIYSYLEANKDCYISYSTFAKWTGMSERTIYRTVKELREQGVIFVGQNTFTETNIYELNSRIIDEWERNYQANRKKKDDDFSTY